ncbi:MAG: CAP domain-containing protein, partial [Sporichthyaceae bacterium]
VLAVFVVGAATARPAGASSTESTVTSKINSARATHSRQRLATRSDLVAVARGQARRMAARNTLYHNPSLAQQVRNFRWVGENVGYGPSVSLVHSAFMASAGHRANVLDRDYTEVGVGAVWANGRLWIAEVFRQPLHTTAASSSSFRYLHYGSAGTRVTRVQKRLGVRATGWYGTVTRAKVLAFQKRRGWRGSGVVGPRTWRALGL